MLEIIMALHIQMSEETLQTLKQMKRRQHLISLSSCICFLILSGIILFSMVIFLEKDLPAQFLPYVSNVEDAPPTDRPVTQELTQKQKPPSQDMAPDLIISTAPSAVAMAQVDIPTVDVPIGTAMEMDLGMGDGIGDELGDAGGGMGSSAAGGSALEGTYYDFKQTKSGAQIGIKTDKFGNVQGAKSLNQLAVILGTFFQRNWSPQVFDRFYKAKTKLYASSFYVPTADGRYGPMAFNAADKIKPGAWAAVYRGRVRAPFTGEFRFVGAGNHFISVRFNNKVVLEAGWSIPSYHRANVANPWGTWCGNLGTSAKYKADIKAGKSRGHRDYKFFPQPEISGWNNALGGLIGGNIIKVEAGKIYPIEILVCDPAGGTFGFALLTEEIGKTKKVKGIPLLSIFRTNFNLPDKNKINQELIKAKFLNAAVLKKYPKKGPQYPNFDPDSVIWTAVP